MHKAKIFLNDLFGKLRLRPIITALRSLKILELDYGHFLSSLKWNACDNSYRPIPWFTYAATEYIKQMDFSQKSIFEYGSGNSTLFWAKRAKLLMSVENDEKWFKYVSRKLVRNKRAKVLLAQTKRSYVNAINVAGEKIDVIVIDGEYRDDCAKQAVKKINRGGFIILDNSDWFPETAKYLRQQNLIEIDMSGFGPINHYISTTSFFLRRDFYLRAKKEIQPVKPIGGI
jgi:hypothetical protein